MDLKNKDGRIYGWAVATPFVIPEGIIWYIHRTQTKRDLLSIPGQTRQLRVFEYTHADIDLYEDGNLRLKSNKEISKVVFRRPKEDVKNDRVLVFIACDPLNPNIHILSTTTGQDFTDFVNRNREFAYLMQPETYRVEFRELKIACTQTVSGIISSVNKHFKISKRSELIDLLDNDTNWYIKNDGEFRELPKMPFIVPRVIKCQSLG